MSSKKCPDCGVEPDEAHHEFCDVARCLHTGLQRLSCGGEGHDCGEDAWNGVWPGEADCVRLGLTTLFGNLIIPDLNRLIQLCAWDRDLRRWDFRDPTNACRGCGKLSMETHYCVECAKTAKCPHGAALGDCGRCDAESDHAYDAQREGR